MKKLFFLLCVAAIFTGCSSKDPNSPRFVVAKGKGFKITRQELTDKRNEQIRLLNLSDEKIPAEQMAVIDAQILDQMITKKLLLAEVAKSDVSKGIEEEVNKAYEQMKESFPDEKAFLEQLEKSGLTPEKVKEEFRNQIAVEKIIESRIQSEDTTVSDEEVKTFYEKNGDLWNRPEQILARHILAFTDPAASEDEKKAKKKIVEQARKRILKGEAFEKVAKELSEDPGTKEYGGMLPPFGKKSRVAPEFTKVAFDQKEGKISPIFQTKYGYHILEVLKRIPAKTFSFDEVQDSIKKQLSQRKKMRASRDVFQQIRDAAEVEILLPELKLSTVEGAPQTSQTQEDA